MKIPVRMQQNEEFVITLYGRHTSAAFPLGWVYVLRLSGEVGVELRDGTEPQLGRQTLNANGILAVVPRAIATRDRAEEPVTLTLRTGANNGFQGEIHLELEVPSQS